jgi:cytochrome c oxidase subunit 3
MSDVTWRNGPLPVGSIGLNGVGWWGALCAVGSEASLFVYLLFGYFYYSVELGPDWFPLKKPLLLTAVPGVVVLIVSAGTMAWAQRAVLRNRRGSVTLALLVTLALGVVFTALQVLDWRFETFTLRSSEYGSELFTITGLHLAHLVAGLLALLAVAVWSALGYFDVRRHAPVLIIALYWYFVVAVGIAVFVALYLMPYLW